MVRQLQMVNLESPLSSVRKWVRVLGADGTIDPSAAMCIHCGTFLATKTSKIWDFRCASALLADSEAVAIVQPWGELFSIAGLKGSFGGPCAGQKGSACRRSMTGISHHGMLYIDSTSRCDGKG